MGTAVVAEELPDADELDELYRLDASEPVPEDEDDGGDGDGDGDGGDGDGDGDGEDDGDGELKPGEMPHE